MIWNNRITKDKNGYALREVFYEGETKSWTEDASTEYFDSPEELIRDLEHKLQDAKQFKDDILEV
jgi:hypothetical protein